MKAAFATIILLITALAPDISFGANLLLDVNATVNEARKLCQQSGGEFSFDAKYLEKLDLNGDHRADYILSTQGFACSTAQSLYSGSDGFLFRIFISGPEHYKASVIASSYQLDQSTIPPQLILTSRCKDDPLKMADRVWQWNGHQMTVKSADAVCH